MTISVVVALIIVFVYVSYKLPKWAYYLFQTLWCASWFVVSVIEDDMFGMIINGSIGLMWAYFFWRNRPPGMKKKLAAIGAKARALKEKLVAAMPEAKPVFLPAPAGV